MYIIQIQVVIQTSMERYVQLELHHYSSSLHGEYMASLTRALSSFKPNDQRTHPENIEPKQETESWMPW